MNPHPAARIARALALLLAMFLVAGTVLLVVWEDQWNRKNVPQLTEESAFINGSIGTEVAPLAVIRVLPALFPAEFHPIDSRLGLAPGTSGDWVEQYGFIRKDRMPKEQSDGTELPVGFVVSYHRPLSGAPSPVPFVALSCAACHSNELRIREDQPGKLLVGVGNSTLNLLAFSEAIRVALTKKIDPIDPKSDYVMTLAAIEQANDQINQPLSTADRILVRLWLQGARAETERYQQVIDTPYSAADLFNPRWIAAGPARTQPFRSLVRVHLNLPGASKVAAQADHGYSKIPVVFHQAKEYHGDWAQFDGSVSDLTVRSTMAASTAGANVHNLSLPDLSTNIINAASYTAELGPPVRWETLFPDHPVKEALLKRGQEVYREHCYACHGGPGDSGGWKAPQGTTAKYGFGQNVPLAEIGTDPERVFFRHAELVVPTVIKKFGPDFGKKHPLEIKPGDLRAAKPGEEGYYNGPISGAFLRAPYLHNASVLNMKELIGLEPRQAKFYRGRNRYDPERMGYWSPPVTSAAVGHDRPAPHDRHYYFLFDTSHRGNSNRGHEYPNWGFRLKPGESLPPQQKADLDALFEYLKTL